MTQLNYEPRVILEHANRLNRRADSMGVTSAIIGAVIGGFFGAVPLTSLGDTWPIPHQFGFGTLLVGVLIGALTGYVIGDARAFGYRLQAQSSLCQLHLERNTAALLADSYSAVPNSRPEPPAAPAPVFEYTEPEPEPGPLAEVHMPEYVTPEPEYLAPATEPEFEPESESLSFTQARISAYLEAAPELEPAPEPAPAATALVPEYVEPVPEPISLVEAAPLADAMPEPISLAEAIPDPISLAEATPEPVPLAEATPAPALARLGEAPPPDLDSMSLEEIAQLAKTGLI